MGETSTRPAQDQGCYPDLIATFSLFVAILIARLAGVYPPGNKAE